MAKVPEQAPARAGPRSRPGLDDAFRAHVTAVHRYLYARVRNRADAEDLTSQVFLKAVRWLDSRRSPGEVRAWLLRTAGTVLAEHWRDHARRRSLLQAAADHALEPAATTGDGRARQEVEAILARLPSRYREVLALRFLEALAPADIGRRLGLRPAHVRVLAFRALRAAAALGRDLGAPEG